MVGHEGVEGDRGHRVRGADQDVLRAIGLGAPVLCPEMNIKELTPLFWFCTIKSLIINKVHKVHLFK